MIKTLDTNATYEPSKRSLNWLKLKKDYLDTGIGDSLDLVVVGCDWGNGKRVGVFGSFLLACWDEDTESLQTVSKVATGLSDEALAKFYNQFKDLVVDKPPENLKFKEKNIDMWLEPKYVWEIKAADLSISPMYCAAIGEIDPAKGIALRFPRFIREREDKSVEEATTSEQIVSFYKSQAVVNFNGMGGDDDYDL
jgi:DNA ligase-1